MIRNTLMIGLAALLLVGSSLACCTIPRIPTIELPEIHVPTVEVGEVREEDRSIPLDGAEAASVEILFGAGELNVTAGPAGQLLVGHFAYNVEQWAPEVMYEDQTLTIRQGGEEKDWGIPTGEVGRMRNKWELAFSPGVPLDIDLKAGAGKGLLDLTGLQLTALDLDVGAGDLEVRFDEPNPAQMRRLTLDAGASTVKLIGIGHAGPDHMQVQGGVGDMTLDLTGDWPASADIDITAGVGSLTLRLPDDVGVEVDVEGGLSKVEVTGLEQRGDSYVNDAFGEAETELHIEIKVGVGNVRLVEVTD